MARTTLGRPERVVVAGHLDTVPAADNLPSRLVDDRLYGLGACDMKGGVAVALTLAARAVEPLHDVTFVFYAGEEVEAVHNGLGHVLEQRPDLLAADFAILMEPSDAGVEAGCQGTLRADVTHHGPSGAQRAVVAGRERDPPRGHRARAARGLRAATRRRSTAWSTARA